MMAIFFITYNMIFYPFPPFCQYISYYRYMYITQVELLIEFCASVVILRLSFLICSCIEWKSLPGYFPQISFINI